MWRLFFQFSPILASVLFWEPKISFGQPSEAAGSADPSSRVQIAILGDSISTGAAAGDDLTYDRNRLVGLMLRPSTPHSLSEPLGSANRDGPVLLPTPVKWFGDPLRWASQSFLWLLSNRYFNRSGESWGAFLAAEFHLRQNDILIAAQNGARAKDGLSQAYAVLEHNKGVWPQKIMIFFTGNDLCAATPLELGRQLDAYADSLRKTLSFITKHGRPAPEGTEIYLIKPLLVSQLLTREEILQKQISIGDEAISCQELQRSQFQPGLNALENPSKLEQELGPASGVHQQILGSFLPPNYAQMCPTIFYFPVIDKEALSTLANAVRGLQAAVEAMRTTHSIPSQEGPEKTSSKVHILSTTEDLLFNGNEIAQDCFHLSPLGQKRLAELLADEMRGSLQPNLDQTTDPTPE